MQKFISNFFHFFKSFFKCERHRFKLNVIFIKFLFHPKLWFFCPGLIRWLPKYPDCPKSSCTKLRLYPKELSFHVRLNLRDKSVDEVLILKSYHGGCRSADNSSLSSLFRLGMSRTQWLWRGIWCLSQAILRPDIFHFRTL